MTSHVVYCGFVLGRGGQAESGGGEGGRIKQGQRTGGIVIFTMKKNQEILYFKVKLVQQLGKRLLRDSRFKIK